MINYSEAIYKIMKLKVPSIKFKEKFIYGDFIENKKADTLAVFMSGFSGSKELPLFKTASTKFLKHGFSTLRFNFCNDSDDKHKKVDALNLEELSFSVYVAELKNTLDLVGKKFSRIVLVGHSFGAPIAILFLNKYKKYTNNTELVLWEPTLLPWKREWMEEDFVFDRNKKLFLGKHTNEILNKVFYKECSHTESTDKVLRLSNCKVCIIAAKDSADKDAGKYFSKIKNKKNSKLFIIKGANHLFSGKRVQKELFKKTMDFLK